jgi:alanyl-tRNA synthetase
LFSSGHVCYGLITGTHLKSLSELQLLKITGIEKDREATRVKFIAGNRAFGQFTSCLQRESALAVSLSVPPKQFTSTVDKLMTERSDNSKKMKEMLLELASLLGRSIAENFLTSMLLNFVMT